MNDFDRDIKITKNDMICKRCKKSIVAVVKDGTIENKTLRPIKHKKCKCEHGHIAVVTEQEHKNMSKAISDWVNR